MGLLKLKTDLTSIRYGKDLRGPGDSKESGFLNKLYSPAITGVEQDFENPSNIPVSGQDVFVRGGWQIGKRIVQDLRRYGNFIASSKGAFFITKQNALIRQQAKFPNAGPIGDY